MVITDIKITKKGKYALFCGSEFLLSVDENTCFDYDLHPGMEIGEDALAELRKRSEYNKALSRAFLILGSRDHSEYELYTKLTRSFDDGTVSAAVARIKELGYLDDERFARRYAEELQRKGRSTVEIRSKLAAKHITSDTAEAVIREIDTDDREALRALIEKRYMNRLRGQRGKEKVYGSLLRKGYMSSDIIAVLNEIEIEPSEDDYE